VSDPALLRGDVGADPVDPLLSVRKCSRIGDDGAVWASDDWRRAAVPWAASSTTARS